MVKIVANTLEEAYNKAAEAFNCSIEELDVEILQEPTSALFGMVKKEAIIVVDKSSDTKVIDAVQQQNNGEEHPKSFSHNDDYTSDEESVSKGYDDHAHEHTLFESVNARPRLAHQIELELKELMASSCFEINVVEVDVIDNVAYIFIDGEDSALLIGKEGYRYNALSYMLFNWLFMKYKLFIKLEIAEFLVSQTQMVRSYMKPVIEQVEKEGEAKTRPLDGILVQIALEILREKFPQKYVVVKTNQFGKRFVVVKKYNNLDE